MHFLVLHDDEFSCISSFPVRTTGHTACEVIFMPKQQQLPACEDLRLNPEARLCPAFDSVSIKKFAAPDAGEMGMRVLDNCAEEHIM